jgi:hypothetical protein
LLVGLNAEAASPRAYVSVNGSDANTCDLPATPCRTLMGGVAQVTAGGVVVVLDSGTFGGGTISKSVTIQASSRVTAIVEATLTVSIGPSDAVTLRGLSFLGFSGSGVGPPGLKFSHGGRLNVENGLIHHWDVGILVENLTGAGILTVVDTTVRHCATGIRFQYVAIDKVTATIARTRLLANGIGLALSGGYEVTISDSYASGNLSALGTTGTAQERIPTLHVQHCVLINNGNAVYAGVDGTSFGQVWISNSTVVGNGYGLRQQGSAELFSRGDNVIEGNLVDIYGTVGSFTGK